MSTTIVKGKVEAVGPITKVGEKGTDLQYIVVFVPGYHDGFERKGRDNMFCLQVMGKKVTELNLTEDKLLGKIIECKCYVDSQYLEPKEEGRDGYYAVNISLNSFEIIK